MDQHRFDALARGMAAPQSRRWAIGRLVTAAVAGVTAALGTGRSGFEASAQPCLDLGCRCRTGALDSCIPGLVCCADDSSLPGGPGTCVAPGSCFGGVCSPDGVVCPSSCAWDANCVGCCSGHCGGEGVCGPGSCRSAGCDCITGTLAPCDEGLACCPAVGGMPGGPGLCLPRSLCN